LFAISYDPVPVLAAFAEKHGIAYDLLSDTGSVVIQRLGLLNQHVAEQHAAYGVALQDRHRGIPYPGVFVLDERGVVVEKRFHQSYRERETGAGLLQALYDTESAEHGTEARAASGGVALRAWLDSDAYRYFQRLYLSVELTVEPGLHIYARPIPEGYIPLAFEFAPIEGLVTGEAVLPEPQPFSIEGLDEQFFVYSGTIVCSIPVTFTKRDAGDLVLSLGVRYQACSDRDCLMPVELKLELPVKFAPAVPQ
jgi:Disulphide bond corrector protein DsbC/AhpC/TSA family